ncbi:MAG: DUF1549 domain-containing protein, partial [Planctomycetales bacterium]|nr:DUF1549 domain-containing protein [Planctomycetales bacterium]
MKIPAFALCFLPVLSLGVAAAAEPADRAGRDFFESKIRPVLVKQCYQCHSATAEKIKGGLVVDTAEGLINGGETGAAVVPGEPGESLLINAIKHEDFEMPPGKRLPDSVIADFERWIKMGAPDPRKSKTPGPVGGPAWTADPEAAQSYWAYQPPQRTSPPKVKNTAWPHGPIDAIVLKELESAGLAPVADADARTLMRRLYFDLIGLPPSAEEAEEFLAAAAKNRDAAVANLVDKLLASPQFGERWGRHWLDIARYAESNGNVDNNLFPYAWRYRDYVIDAFNSDKPYDQFVTEQLAGDLLESDNVDQRNRNLIATGFLALTSKPRAQNNPDFQMDLVADQIEVATASLMGLTVGCARCHDHKFDPIPQTDYYALAGFFTSSEMLYGTTTQNGKKTGVKPKVLELATDSPDEAPADAEASKRLAALEAKRDRLTDQQQSLQRKIKTAKQSGDAAKDVRQQYQTVREELAEVEKQIAELGTKVPKGSGAFAMGMRDGRVADCTLCIRGESEKRGPAVPRGFPTVIRTADAPAVPAEASGRLELAQWMTSPDHPLTSRVMANRIWQHLMGRGVVPSVDNFGKLGEAPSNQALIDHLAVEFVSGGWSVKGLIRQIALSRTYQLSSDYDAKAYDKD